MEMTKKNLGAFKIDFLSAIKALEGQYGVILELGNISYSDNSFTSKITVTNGMDKGEAEKNTFAKDLDRYGDRYPVIEMKHHTEGLTISDKTSRYDGRAIIIVRLKASPKFPIIYRFKHHARSKMYKASYSLIKKAILQGAYSE